MNKLLVIGITVATGLMMAGTSYASYGSVACEPIYGGGTNCETSNKFTLDKKVMDPSSNTKGGTVKFVDNLSINDAKYAPNQTVKFQLVVTNTSDKTLDQVTLTDILPSVVNFVAGSGNYNSSTNTLTLNVVNLNPNESRTYIITTKVKDAASLPNGQGIVCVVNQASATNGNNQSSDNSQFCIEKKPGLPVMSAPKMTSTPATGPEMLGLLGLIPAAAAGIFLRRRSK